MSLRIACRFAAFAGLGLALWGAAWGQNDCKKPVYLTLDTGHMEVAPFIADTLRKHQVKVTFFAANELTKTGDGSLGEYWAPWWRERGLEGHSFASHTLDHVVWRADLPSVAGEAQFTVQPSAGSQSGRKMRYSAAQYCGQLKASAARLSAVTGQTVLPLFRAPGGKTSPALLAAASACGFAHVGWAAFWASSCPAKNSVTRHYWPKRCAIFAAATFFWRIWVSGRVKTHGRPPC